MATGRSTPAPHGAGRRIGVRGRNVGSKADWSTVDAELIRELVAVASRFGGAIRFGYSRDGGAYAIGVLGDGDPYTEYVRPSEDVDSWLAEFTLAWKESFTPPDAA